MFIFTLQRKRKVIPMLHQAQQILTYKVVQTRLHISLNSALDGGECPVYAVVSLPSAERSADAQLGVGWTVELE
jgi:hypothetical protein